MCLLVLQHKPTDQVPECFDFEGGCNNIALIFPIQQLQSQGLNNFAEVQEPGPDVQVLLALRPFLLVALYSLA